MLSLRESIEENIIGESIIPKVKPGQTTLYDMIKDNIKGIVYKRQMGYTHYVDVKALKKFIRDNKPDDKDMFVTTKGKKPTAPEPLQQLFVILCKCIVIDKDEKIDGFKKYEDQMKEILKANGIDWSPYLTKFYFCMMIGSGTECNLNFDDTNWEIFGY